MEALRASLKTRFGARLSFLPFKLAALLLLMVAPAQAALQQSNCLPTISGYSDQAGGDMPSLTPLRAVPAFANATFQPDADTGLVPLGAEMPDIADTIHRSVAVRSIFLAARLSEWSEALARKRAPPHKA